jgi:hypothetical protein
MHLLLYIYYLLSTQETIILQVTLFTDIDIMMTNKVVYFLRYAPVVLIQNQSLTRTKQGVPSMSEPGSAEPVVIFKVFRCSLDCSSAECISNEI